MTEQMNGSRATHEPGRRRALTILLVEDDVLVRFVAADILRDAHHEVIEAVNGDEAIALLSAGLVVDLVITDVNMPGEIDGLRLATLVNARFPELPVLMTSALPPVIDILPAGFLPKPYRAETLLNAVQGLAPVNDA